MRPAGSLPERLERSAAGLAAALDLHRIATAAGLAVLAVLAVIPSALWKPLWYDELYTVYVAGLPSIGTIRDALAQGLDQQPLPYLVAHHAVFAALGQSPVTARLPEMLGLGLASLALFGFVAHRSGAVYGALAVAFVLSTELRYYATEARPYALQSGFAALSLLAWQRATEPRHRTLRLAGLALSLALLVSCHWYGVLVGLALGAGEIARSIERRRIDLAIWIAFAGALVPIALFLLPILPSLTKLSATFWARPVPTFPLEFYRWLLEPAALALAASIAAAGVCILAGPAREASPLAGERPSPPRHEVVAAIVLAALPFFGLALAYGFTNAINERYVLPAVIGLGVLLGWSVAGLSRRTGLVTLWMLVLLAVFGVRQMQIARWAHAGRDQFREIRLPAADAEPGLPIVVQDPLLFLEYAHNTEPALATRLRYVADPAEQARFTGFANVDPGLLLMREFVPVAVEPAGAFLAKHPRFYLLYTKGRFGWMSQWLAAEGARVELVEGGTGSLLLLVDRSPAGRAP